MSISLLYHTNQITNIQEKKSVEYLSDKIVFHVQYHPKGELCPCCGSKEYTLKGLKIRINSSCDEGAIAFILDEI